MKSKPVILVIEDDADIRALLRLALTIEGYEIIEASDGRQALDQLEDFEPDLIFLDMNMPVMNGWTFLTYYLHSPGWHAPVVATSAQTVNPRNIPGITAFLAKPFDIAQLRETIGRYIGKPAAV